jgi:hypothetical protein
LRLFTNLLLHLLIKILGGQFFKHLITITGPFNSVTKLSAAVIAFYTMGAIRRLSPSAR